MVVSGGYQTLTLGLDAVDVLDLDGTIDCGDWGAAFYRSKFGTPEMKFHEMVNRIREDSDYRKEVLEVAGYNDGRYSPGEELAVLSILDKIPKKDLVEFLSQYENGHRKGFEDYVLTDWPKVVVSACIEDLVIERGRDIKRKLNGKQAGKIEFFGTKMNVNEQGIYTGIVRGCGSDRKPEIIKPYINRGIIAAGDGESDIGLMKATEQHGFGISFGNPRMGDVVVPEDASWYYFWLFAADLRGKPVDRFIGRSGEVDIYSITPRTAKGESELIKLKNI